ncbi:TetR family transcriptional regulator [Xanthomonas citri pv. citri]|uniref:TetR family transcriptional regulator n=2 Tax=Xanthomonas citri TaxID=346 RepID=A0A7U2LJC3_XANCI|nr:MULTISPECIES: hypothetical protein [Xanthomonas]AGH77028.1 hypothetical protein XAC29_07680 [Xanthomonas axonopodis Xac29-1]AGI08581.1 Hypothetical Protein XCAW_02804 [Xanthomonas citri subsp. citri Aw12879]AJD68118.1 hypothetical protein J151_01674 [Xanthomonas citri subsp. citri A306]AJY81651.1 hypothetical protein J159_01670 [Xanthomonas citri pv. citri]AJY86073.1 hypothetical protein J158_01670 [Xanthomonas citri subsp. citri UI6]
MNDVTGSFGNTVVEQGQTLKGARPMLQANGPTARSGLGFARVAGNNVLRLKAMATLQDARAMGGDVAGNLTRWR